LAANSENRLPAGKMKEIVLKNSSLLPVSFCCFVFGSLLVTTAGAQSAAPPQQVTNSIGMKLVQ